MNDEHLFDSEDMLPIPLPPPRQRRPQRPAPPPSHVILRTVRSALDIVQVWNLWTTAEGLERWWWPHLPDATYRLNPQPGGLYSIRSHLAEVGVEGYFLEVLPPQALSLTWQWVGDPTGPDVVHVNLVAQVEGGCEVQVRHETLSATPELYERGWSDVLGRLAALAAPGGGPQLVGAAGARARPASR